MMMRSARPATLPFRLLPLLVILAFLVACGGSPPNGGGGGGGGNDDPLAITQVRAPTSTSVELVFNEALGGGADTPENFVLTDPDGGRLQVLAAYPDDGATTVTLATQPQSLVDYAVRAQNLTAGDGRTVASVDAATPVAGSDVVAPAVASAVPLSNTTVLVTFFDPGTAQGAPMERNAEDARFYRITEPDLAIESAALQEDGTSVILTTAPQERETYTVRVSNVYSRDGGRLIDPFANSADFAGIPPEDTDPPVVTDLTVVDNTTVLISFSEPLDDDAAERTRYSIRDDADLPLAVLDAALDPFKTTVTLTTGAQTQGTTYTLELIGLRDLAGNEIVQGSTETFVGATPTGTGSDTTPPRVLGATSLDNKAVVVTFSEALDRASAEQAANYSVFGAPARDQLAPQAILVVTGAALNDGGRSVTLTTLSQSGIQYVLQVANVKDLAGNFIAPPSRDEPYVANFRGTAPSGSDASDTDGDGLNDDVEQRGWTVRVRLLDGSETTREVTSDPTDPDTDNDGLTDDVEFSQSLDPRNADTDADDLSDDDEFNRYYSEPLLQDTDGDGLVDGLEITLFKTDPTVDDTDADGLLDGDEVGINNANPRAILADLPRFDTVIGSVDLSLDYRFNETTSEGTTEGATQSTGFTTLEANTTTSSRQNSSSQNWFAKAGTEFCFGGTCASENGGLLGVLSPNFGFKFTAEAGGGGETAFVTTEESAEAVQNEYAETLETSKVVSSETTLEREVVGAAVRVSVDFASQSNVSFVIKEIELTAQIVDPSDPSRLLPIGKLVPSDGLEIALGPKGSDQGTRGPIVFEVESPFPSVVERLMQNPSGILVSLANYRIETRRAGTYVFDLEQINNRTAQVEIDYGGRRDTMRYHPATYAGFDAAGRPQGITLRRFMADFLELDHVVATPSGNGRSCTETTAPSELTSSYATCAITADGVTTEALWRVRDVSRSDNPDATSWWVLTPDDGLITPVPEYEADPWPGRDFGSYELRSGQAYVMKFVRDEDNDGLEATIEASFGSSDTVRDSDGDGIDDGEEVYGPRDTDGLRRGWPIELGDGTVVRTSSNPARPDSDRDGLDDCQELAYVPPAPPTGPAPTPCATITVHDAASGPNLTGDGTQVAQFTLPAPTDPSDPDTDGEGLPDGVEVAGIAYRIYDDTLTLVDRTLLPRQRTDPTTFVPAIDPLRPNSDTDVLSDFMEIRLGTDPTVDDGDKVLDDDGDGMVNLEETIGWTVTTFGVSQSPRAQGPGTSTTVRSRTDAADADGDGWTDPTEKARGTNPGAADTDGDGIPDPSDPDPRDADADNDLLRDDREAAGCNGSGALSATNPDQDNDGLVDGEECAGNFLSPARQTNPANPDTDGDGVDDRREVLRNRDSDTANNTNPVAADQLLDVRYRYVRGFSDCAAGVDIEYGDADLQGSIYFEVAGSTRVYPYAFFVNEKSTSLVPNTFFEPFPVPIRLILPAGQSIRAYSNGLAEDDDPSANNRPGDLETAIPDEALIQFDETFGPVPFAASVSKLFLVHGPGNPNFCRIEFPFEIVINPDF